MHRAPGAAARHAAGCVAPVAEGSRLTGRGGDGRRVSSLSRVHGSMHYTTTSANHSPAWLASANKGPPSLAARPLRQSHAYNTSVTAGAKAKASAAAKVHPAPRILTLFKAKSPEILNPEPLYPEP